MHTIVHTAATNEVDQKYHLQSEMAEAQSHIFEFPSMHVHSMVLRRCWCIRCWWNDCVIWSMLKPSKWNCIPLTEIQLTCLSMTFGVGRTMVGHGSTCTDPRPTWPIHKSDPFDPLTHDPSTHCLLCCPSVRPCVKRVICAKTKESCVHIFIPYKRTCTLVFW